MPYLESREAKRNGYLLEPKEEMTFMETYDRDIHGNILWECTCSQCYMRSVSLFYVLFTAFWIVSLPYTGIWSYLCATIIFLFSIWRIYRVHRSVVLVCEKRILFNVPRTSISWRLASIFKTQYISFPYDEIVGISEDWNYLFLGERISGGIAEAPIQIRFVSKEDKEAIAEWIQRKKQDNDR